MLQCGMITEFKEDQSEEYYRKLLLLDKVKPLLRLHQKFYIFELKFCWNILLNDKLAAVLCYKYAEEILKAPFPEGEKAISTDPHCSYWYANSILNDRFPLGEPAIAQDSYMAYSYAIDVLDGPFPLGEKSIAKDPAYATGYAERILKDRFPLAESAILNSHYNLDYMKLLVKIGKRHELKI